MSLRSDQPTAQKELSGKELRCPLCGSLIVGEASTCRLCPFSKGCDFVICPVCSYEFPKT